MPELPEVETTVKGLRKTILGLTIKNVWTDLATKDKRQKSSIANLKFFVVFKKEILNKKILSVERRAKNILINTSDGKTILVHLKMTGHLLYGKYKFQPPPPPPPPKRGGGGGGGGVFVKRAPPPHPHNYFILHFFFF